MSRIFVLNSISSLFIYGHYHCSQEKDNAHQWVAPRLPAATQTKYIRSPVLKLVWLK